MKLRKTYQSWLVPYGEGTLDPIRTALLETRLAQDSVLAAEAAALQSVARRLRQSAAENAPESDPRLSIDPSSLWPGVEARLTSSRRTAKSIRPVWALCACIASLAAGVFLRDLWHDTNSGPEPHTIAATNYNQKTHVSPVVASRGNHRHRLHSRTNTRLAARFPLPKKLVKFAQKSEHFPAPDVDQTPVPDDQPPPRAAVLLSDGQSRFRLASPVTTETKTDDLNGSSATVDGRDSDISSAPESSQTAHVSASKKSAEEATSDATVPQKASVRHKAGRRRHRRHHAAPRVVPTAPLATPSAPTVLHSPPA